MSHNVNSKDFYEVLGVKKGASSSDVRHAFRRRAQRIHPDKFHAEGEGSPMPAAATAAFLRLQQAHWVLGDLTRRRDYDRPGW